jgi:hypothetical protein
VKYKHFILKSNLILSNLKAYVDSQFLDGDVNHADRQGIFKSNLQMSKKKSRTQAGDTLSKRFLDSTLIQHGKIVNLTESPNLIHVAKRFAVGKFVQQADMISKFQLGKKNISTEDFESLSKKHLDGNVEQHEKTLSNMQTINIFVNGAANFQKTGKNPYFYYSKINNSTLNRLFKKF